MEESMTRKNPRKRQVVLSDEDDCTDKAYRFKVLLPNGTSVELNLRDPDPEMPFKDFIDLVKDKYLVSRKQSESMEKKRDINWKAGNLFLEDANDARIRNMVKFKNYKPHKCHILRLHDGCSDIAKTFANMWDLTPDTDLLMELPEEYAFETALADLIDNSLQAVWSNKENERRLIRVNLVQDKISIFDSGPGMDDTDENSLVKWGKMGASLHRSSKSQAIGGKPPYLLPYFGMFGYGGPIASMHLGKRALVSSKTKHAKKVYMLLIEREALLSSSGSELTWKTDGGIRNPSDNEIRNSRHGSFTKVVIFQPKVICENIYRLQCHLKDIYFPYIQCDDMSDTGKTATPIEFKVNDVDLTEIEGGEVAITNLHSCNGPEFVLQLHFSLLHQCNGIKSPGSRTSQEANARLRCVYFPFREGKENIEKILGKLEADGCGIRENFQTFSRVSIRRLGRLLPDARWASLPFMDFRNKRGNKAQLLKRCCLRVKCFIETDAGFKPTLSKAYNNLGNALKDVGRVEEAIQCYNVLITDLAHHNPFTTALKNLGNKISEKEKEIVVEIRKDGKLLPPSRLEKAYQEWILQMHDHYDEETDSGEDQPVIIVNPPNKKALGISSDVVRVHRILKRKEKYWNHGQKIKALKGASAVCNKNIYATIEYFLLEGFQGDAGGEARIICRPIDVPDESGCVLSVGIENASLDIRGSLSLPLSVIDSGKLVAVESIEWDTQLDKKQQNSPATVDLLSSNHCNQLEVDGVLPINAPIFAGHVPPNQVVAVVRPVNFIAGASNNLDQKHIFKSNIEMSMEIKFKGEIEESYEVIDSACVPPSAYKGFNGLYLFPLKCRVPEIFQRAGVYVFSFSLMESSCKKCEKRVIVKPSPIVGKWRPLSDDQTQPLNLRVGSRLPPLSLSCYDIYNNQMPFKSGLEVIVKLEAAKGLLFKVDRMRMSLSTDKLTSNIKNVLVESVEIDKIRPGYEATLVIASCCERFSVPIPCQVCPGPLQHVELRPFIPEKQLFPGYIFKELMLEMFDAYGNHVSKGLEVTLSLVGFIIQDHVGMIRKVDDNGRIDLSGLLKVTAGYGKNASISVLFEDKIIFKEGFLTVGRKLRIASKVPDSCVAGGQLENIDFEIVDPEGHIDKNIHHNDKDGQSHMLTIKSVSFATEESIRYTFKQGRCTIPAIPLPSNEGCFCFEAAHSQYPELCLIVKVPVVKTQKVQYDESQPPSSDKSIVHLPDSPSFNQEMKLMISFVNNDKELQEDIFRIGELIGEIERNLGVFNNCKAETEQEMFRLQAKVACLPTKEELKKRIDGMENSAAAVVCSLSTHQMPQKSLMEDIIGVVALLGTVQSPELGRILAEYLGEDKMLAIICRTFHTAIALERYKQSGEVDFTSALHAEAAALGKAISSRFLVICLEDVRPYTGGCEGNDPQKKLAFPDPVLRNGSIPAGFVGYAVNMVDLDYHHLQTRTASGHSLRETVLFSLFRKLHVYETREYMLAARVCIVDGAVSLDGGIIRENGIISLGYGNPLICFPCESRMLIPSETREIMMQIEEKKLELRMFEDQIGKETKLREKYLKKFEKRKRKSLRLIDRIPTVLTNHLLEYETSTKDGSSMSDRFS